jgi:cell division GTPase FtsZ
MKIAVIGFGQCGGMIADEFARLNQRAHANRGINIIIDAFAVNTGVSELGVLQTIRQDYRHRIIIGSGKTRGHGAAKLGEFGAEIAREDRDNVVTAIRETKRLGEADAILMVAATAGGTGSGAMPVIAECIKERFWSKPVFCMAVLPFEHEEVAEISTVYNTALCLKSSRAVADALFLIENQRFLRKDSSLQYNTAGINQLIVEPFYNLLCAGEEKKPRHIGTRVLDAGDIIQTLSGWTVMGYGKSLLSLIPLPFESRGDYRKMSAAVTRGLHAMEEAITSITFPCRPEDATSGLYLVSAPASEMQANLLAELSEFLRIKTPNAVLRVGDYPDERGIMDISVILSGLSEVPRVMEYYIKAAGLLRHDRL